VTLQIPANGIGENTHEYPLNLPCSNRLGPPRYAWVRRAHRCLGGRGVPLQLFAALVFLGAPRWSRDWPERTLCDVSKHLRFGRYRVNSGHCADIAFR
jgi:hypothetical protein